MTKTAFPSEVFPNPPSISLDAPEGWEPIVVASTVLAIAAPLVTGEFRQNAIVAWSRHDGGFTLEAASAAVRDRLAATPDLETVADADYTVSGFPAHHFETTFVAEGAGTLAQLTDLVLVERGPVKDLFEVTATCSAPQIETSFNVLRQILAGAVIAGA